MQCAQPNDRSRHAGLHSDPLTRKPRRENTTASLFAHQRGPIPLRSPAEIPCENYRHARERRLGRYGDVILSHHPAPIVPPCQGPGWRTADTGATSPLRPVSAEARSTARVPATPMRSIRRNRCTVVPREARAVPAQPIRSVCGFDFRLHYCPVKR
jgi:hypothetical protein